MKTCLSIFLICLLSVPLFSQTKQRASDALNSRPGPDTSKHKTERAWDENALEPSEPAFQGSVYAYMDSLKKRVKSPNTEHPLKGRVIVQFNVNKDCSLSNFVVLRGLRPDYDSAAVKAISSMPKFSKPGLLKGKPVVTFYTVPVTFK